MSDLRDLGLMLEAAERAAAADDLTSADELLRDIARIQEAQLGPLHPDLASTLNNRAVIAEKTGRLDDAERFYRQAVAIATASLPVDHPMIAASRANLEDFCRARGLPIDPPSPTAPAATDNTVAARLDAKVPAPAPQKAAPRRPSRPLAQAAIGVAVVLIAAAFLMRSCVASAPAPAVQPASPQTAEQTAPASPRSAERIEPASPQPAEREVPSPAEVATQSDPIKQEQPPTAAPRSDDRGVSTAKPTASTPSSSSIALVTAQLCRTFSTSEARWRCDPAADPISPGAIVLLTRVRSPTDAAVVHRWYRGDTLRQSVKLTIRANAAEGYRTYSRQTADAGEWRVEVRSAEGALLHEQRFVVR